MALSNDAVRGTRWPIRALSVWGPLWSPAVVRDDLALVSNVGDSRAYHITREGLGRSAGTTPWWRYGGKRAT